MTANTVLAPGASYAARLHVDYPATLDRLTTLLRLIWIVPIGIVMSLLSAGLWLATVLMIAVRVLYPRWWFDFARELTRLGRAGRGLPRTADRSLPIDRRGAVRASRDRLPRRRARPPTRHPWAQRDPS